jgi:hypothetical protein
MMFISELPAISPFALIEVATLQLSSPGSAPKSITAPLSHLKAWKTEWSLPSMPPQMPELLSGGAGSDVADEPTAVPCSFIWLAAPNENAALMKLAGPPNVPMSTSLYR